MPVLKIISRDENGNPTETHEVLSVEKKVYIRRLYKNNRLIRHTAIHGDTTMVDKHYGPNGNRTLKTTHNDDGELNGINAYLTFHESGVRKVSLGFINGKMGAVKDKYCYVKYGEDGSLIQCGFNTEKILDRWKETDKFGETTLDVHFGKDNKMILNETQRSNPKYWFKVVIDDEAKTVTKINITEEEFKEIGVSEQDEPECGDIGQLLALLGVLNGLEKKKNAEEA